MNTDRQQIAACDAEKIKQACFFIEANAYEEAALFVEYQGTEFEWDDHGPSIFVKIGMLQDESIFAFFRFATIGDNMLCFYEITSQVCDHRKMRSFLEQYSVYGQQISRYCCDALNFHQAILHIKTINSNPTTDDTEQDVIFDKNAIVPFYSGQRVQIPVSQIEFNVEGNTIWIQSTSGATTMRIKTNGKIRIDKCETSPTSHCDIVVSDDIQFCLSADAQ